MLQVVVSSGDEVLARAAFKARVITVGRSPDNVIQLDHPSLSRHHARIEPQGRGWLIRDMASTNGLHKDGQRVTEWSINDGDEISIGEYLLTFSVEEDAAPALRRDDEDAVAPPPLSEHLAELAVLGATFTTPSSPQLDQAARERSSNLRAHLVDDETGTCWLIDHDAFVVGAVATADLQIPGFLAPRVGAVLVRGYGGFSVVNVAGREGWVRVDDTAVAGSAHLHSRARLQVGPRALRFVLGAPPTGVEVVAQVSRAKRVDAAV